MYVCVCVCVSVKTALLMRRSPLSLFVFSDVSLTLSCCCCSSSGDCRYCCCCCCFVARIRVHSGVLLLYDCVGNTAFLPRDHSAWRRAFSSFFPPFLPSFLPSFVHVRLSNWCATTVSSGEVPFGVVLSSLPCVVPFLVFVCLFLSPPLSLFLSSVARLTPFFSWRTSHSL